MRESSSHPPRPPLKRSSTTIRGLKATARPVSTVAQDSALVTDLSKDRRRSSGIFSTLFGSTAPARSSEKK